MAVQNQIGKTTRSQVPAKLPPISRGTPTKSTNHNHSIPQRIFLHSVVMLTKTHPKYIPLIRQIILQKQAARKPPNDCSTPLVINTAGLLSKTYNS